MNMKQLLDKLSYECEEFVECFSYNSNASCSCGSSTPVISVYGKCYNFHNLGIQNFPDIFGGLQILLKQPNNSFYEVYPKLAIKALKLSGFSVSLEYNFGTQSSDRFALIPMNVYAYVVLSPK